MLLVEVGEPSLRRNIEDLSLNVEHLRGELNTLSKRREVVAIWTK